MRFRKLAQKNPIGLLARGAGHMLAVPSRVLSSSLCAAAAFFTLLNLNPAQAGPLTLGQGADKKNALGVYSAGDYSVLSDLSLSTTRRCGGAGDIPVPGNYLNGVEARTAVWSPSFGIWRVCAEGSSVEHRWGMPGDLPVAGDFNGDGLTDFGIFRPQTAEWFIRLNTGGVTPGAVQTFSFGQPGDTGLAEDFDGDSIADAAVFRSDVATGGTTWRVRLSTGGELQQAFGLVGDLPVAADYSGLGRAQFAVWRANEAAWYVLNSGNVNRFAFGLPGDVPSPIDINNDGTVELAVYRPGDARWFVRVSANASTQPAVALQGVVGARVANHSRAAIVDRVAALDTDGDRSSDLVVVRKGDNDALQFLFHSGSDRQHPVPLVNLGSVGDRTAFADYDGDGLVDPAVVTKQGSFLVWQVILSAAQRLGKQVLHVTYGLVGDEIVSGDFDGDRRSDLAVVRTLPDGNKLWLPNASGVLPVDPVLWGLVGDQSLAADVDGDGKADYVAVREIAGELVWFIRTASGAQLPAKRFGLAGDSTLIGDYNGDGRAELGVKRVVNGFSVIIVDGLAPFVWGLEGDVTLAGNYFGIKSVSVAVWRVINSQGFFFIRRSNGVPQVVPFGVIGDLPMSPLQSLDTEAGSVSGPPQGPTTPTDGGGAGGGGQRLSCASRTSIASQESGFVWKPVSEGDGNLVVLFGSSRGGSVRRAALVEERPEGDVVLDTLNFVGNTNGGRPTFRAGRRGGSYPANVILVRQGTDNSVHCIVVPNPGQRYG